MFQRKRYFSKRLSGATSLKTALIALCCLQIQDSRINALPATQLCPSNYPYHLSFRPTHTAHTTNTCRCLSLFPPTFLKVLFKFMIHEAFLLPHPNRSLSCLYFHRTRKCTQRHKHYSLSPSFSYSCYHLHHFSFTHHLLYRLGAQLIEISTVCLAMCAKNHISHHYRNMKHPLPRYRRKTQGHIGTQCWSQDSNPHLLNSKAFAISRPPLCPLREKNKLEQLSEKVLAQ